MGLPTNGKEAVKIRYAPSLYMVKVMAKYTARLPQMKNWFTAVQ